MRYESPQTVDAAVAALAAEKGLAKVLAGGTDLLVQMRTGRLEPDLVVDLKRIPGMMDIAEADGGFRIGAGVCCAALGEHAALKAAWPGVVEAANLIGSTQVQGRATMSGNLCNASPAADTVPALIAADAAIEIAGPDGTRSVAAEAFSEGPGKTVLKQGEMVTAILLPPRPARSGDAYLRFIPRTEMDIAVVGAGVSVTLDEAGTCTAARVGLGAVAARALCVDAAAEALIGTPLDDAALDACAAAASAAASPIDDKRGTVAYRIKVSGVLTRRAAVIAHTRATGENA
jgi:CO/xanthine dehydrogenase FAD-binding subunit